MNGALLRQLYLSGWTTGGQLVVVTLTLICTYTAVYTA